MMITAMQEVVVISHSDIKERVEQFVQVPVIEDIPHYKETAHLLELYQEWNISKQIGT